MEKGSGYSRPLPHALREGLRRLCEHWSGRVHCLDTFWVPFCVSLCVLQSQSLSTEEWCPHTAMAATPASCSTGRGVTEAGKLLHISTLPLPQPPVFTPRTHPAAEKTSDRQTARRNVLPISEKCVNGSVECVSSSSHLLPHLPAHSGPRVPFSCSHS